MAVRAKFTEQLVFQVTVGAAVRIRTLAEDREVSVAQVVREAVDAYLIGITDTHSAGRHEAMSFTTGKYVVK